MRLTREQQKIIYAGIIVAIAIFLFLIFIFLPRSREVNSIKNSLRVAERNISEIIGVGEGKELIDIARDLGLDLSRLKRKIPSRDETIIKNLSEEARKHKIEIKRIDFSKKDESTHKIGSLNIEEMVVSLDLVGEYKEIGRYLEILRNDFPILVTINRVNIKGDGEGKASLRISLDISTYLSK